MKSRWIILAALAILVTVVLVVVMRHRTREVDMILTNGQFHTVNPAQPVAEALAVHEGIIVGVGTRAEILERFKGDTVIDLGGRPVYPGFVDAHAHLEGLGSPSMYLDVSGTRSEAEVQTRVRNDVAHRREGEWIRGRGWDQNLWPGKNMPHHALLDALTPRNPVILMRVDGHAAWANGAALALAKVTRQTPDPEGGKILRDAHGEPTGVFLDNAITLLLNVLPPPSRAERKEAIRRAVQACLAVGLTQVHDMGVDQELISIYKELIAEHDFPFRVYAAIDGTGDTWKQYVKSGPDLGDREGRLTVRALKMYMDGALGSRGAALLAPYRDDPGNRGLTLLSADSLRRVAEECLAAGFQLCVHAIGDRANGIVLGAYDSAFTLRRQTGSEVRFRIEHAQVLSAPDVKKFHVLGVIPVMQPTHCTSDMGWVDDRIGPERSALAYAWRTLLDDGNIIPGSSDFPVESPDPLRGFYAAVTRQDADGNPPGGWHPDQRMTRDEALRAFTIWASYAAFEEEKKGSLEVGKWADFVILSDDIMTIPVPSLLKTRVEATYVAGVRVFDATAPPAERTEE